MRARRVLDAPTKIVEMRAAKRIQRHWRARECELEVIHECMMSVKKIVEMQAVKRI